MSADAPLVRQVLFALADGELHSGEQLAGAAGVSRSAVWKVVGQLQEMGLAIEAATNRGYRLLDPFVPLDAAAIRARLDPEAQAMLRHGEVAWELPSTNDALLARGELPAGRFDFLLAEHQSAGRGRRARAWYAPPGGALCLSLNWGYPSLPRGAAALSLATGVCVRRVLAAWGVEGVTLKWPNDLYVEARKLGGILIELHAEGGGPATMVIGVGLNCALGAELAARVRAAGVEAVDMAQLGFPLCDRNRLAAELVGELVRGARQFGAQGFAPFAQEWQQADALLGRVVQVSQGSTLYVGHARGIDADGALCVHGPEGLRCFNSGEVSVRLES